MKVKVITILVALFFSVSLFSQVRRSFWGITLGVSTKQQVYTTMTKKGFKLTWSAERNSYETGNVTFAGHFWPFLAFHISNGKLMRVAFMDGTLSTPSETLDLLFENLKTSLKIKYKGKEKKNDKDTYYDGKTSVSVVQHYTGGEKFVTLGYTDEYLFTEEVNKITDDL